MFTKEKKVISNLKALSESTNLVTENVFDFLIKLVTAMAHEQDLEGFFDSNGALE